MRPPIDRYLMGAVYDEQAAFDDVAAELSNPLGYLFYRHLADEEDWFGWAIDDALPSWMEPIDPSTARMTGVAWLLTGGDALVHPSQPFEAMISLTAARTALDSYRLRFGDAAIGLGRGSDRLRRSWPDVDRWLFEFTRPTDRQPDSVG